MRDHGGYPSSDWPSNCQYFDIAVVGGGNGNPPTAPTGVNYPFFDGSTVDYPKSCNALSLLAAEAPTRSGTGLYALQYGLAFTLPAVLNLQPEVYGASGVWAQVASWNPATRTINVRVFNASGAAVDLQTTDLLILSQKSRDTSRTGAGKT